MKRIKMTPVQVAIDMAEHAFGRIHETEELRLDRALGYKLAQRARVLTDLPPYTKSTVDGYAVRHKDLLGASSDVPVVLTLKGESVMGKTSAMVLSAGEAVYVPTGGMVPGGADAVVMIEDVVREGECIRVKKRLFPNENLIQKGEDLKAGDTGLESGVILAPRHIGLLAAMGYETVEVMRKPKVAIISNGDELVELGGKLSDGEIYDINTHSLKALCQIWGLEVVAQRVVKDDFESLCRAVKEASMASDLLLISGGSSVGEKDMTVEAVMTLQDAEKIVHGLAFKPGKPTLIAKAGTRMILGLPGHPVSALMVMETVGRALLGSVWGLQPPQQQVLEGRLMTDVVPATGRDTCEMVRIEAEGEDIMIHPIRGKSGMISWIGKSSGYIVIKHESGTAPAGALVPVYLWEHSERPMPSTWAEF